MVQTEIELLKSDNVSRAVINKLHLTEDPEFAGLPWIYRFSYQPRARFICNPIGGG
jgi:uncharacterized protein involved in exopolysaccharide biosynthesis